MPEKFGVSFVLLYRQLEDFDYVRYVRKARRGGVGAFCLIANNQRELSVARSISEILTKRDYFFTSVTEFSHWDRLKGILQRKYIPTGRAILVAPGYPRNIFHAIVRSL